jgi:transcriptional regulator with XRE-family HTH domain
LKNFDKGKRLKDARHQAGLTQVEMAQHLKIDPTYLSQLEKGRKPVDDYYLELADRVLKNLTDSNVLKEATPAYGKTPRQRCIEVIDEQMDSIPQEYHDAFFSGIYDASRSLGATLRGRARLEAPMDFADQQKTQPQKLSKGGTQVPTPGQEQTAKELIPDKPPDSNERKPKK